MSICHIILIVISPMDKKRTKSKNVKIKKDKKSKKVVLQDELSSESDNVYDSSEDELNYKKKLNKKNEEIKFLKEKISYHNKTVDIVNKRIEFAKIFHRSFVNFVTDKKPFERDDFVGFIDIIPRQIFEMSSTKINISNTRNSTYDGIKKTNFLSYVLYDTTDPSLETIIEFLGIMNKIKLVLQAKKTITFSEYTLKTINDKDATKHNLNYVMIFENKALDDRLVIDFWHNRSQLRKDSLNITGMSINDTGICVRGSDYCNMIFKEEEATSMEEFMRNEETHMFDIISNIINSKTDITDRKSILKCINDLAKKTMNRKSKVKKYIEILNFYSLNLPLLGEKYLDSMNFCGLPKFYIEQKEDCTYTAISPPYLKLNLICGHDMSLQAIYGLIVDGENDDTEAINCPLCKRQLEFVIEKKEKKDNKSEKNKAEPYNINNILDLLPSANNEVEYFSVDPNINPEANEYIDLMIGKYVKKISQECSCYDSEDSDDYDEESDY